MFCISSRWDIKLGLDVMLAATMTTAIQIERATSVWNSKGDVEIAPRMHIFEREQDMVSAY
jgi:hypothetical protein